MPALHSALGYAALLALAWLAGRRSRRLPWKTILIATLLQVAGAALLLLTGLRGQVFGLVEGLTRLLKATALRASESLLFIGVSSPSFTQTYGPIIALEIACILIFMAALSRLLYHYRVLPWIIAWLSRTMQRLMGLSAAESVSAAANVFLGMVEAPLFIRPYVARLTESELFCVMSAGLAGIAGTVLVVYAAMLSPINPDMAGHLFVASLISAPAAVAVAKIMIPETGRPETAGRRLDLPRDDTLNGLDAAAQGAAEGMQLFLNIAAMLIAFIGLVALGNAAVGALEGWLNGRAGGWSLQAAAGWLFRLPVWLMGIPWAEAQAAGELMGLKTVLNEFVAYVELARRMQEGTPLSQRSFVILTYALCSFANFGSVAIMIGGIGGIAPSRRGDLARLGMRSLLAGTIAAMLTGCVVGLFV
jgi:CNT family concentrative nucleoside transporter